MQKNFIGESGMISIKFGKEENISQIWKEIVKLNDENIRKSYIDNLLQLLESNSDKNGFFTRDDMIDCGQGHGFLLDDKELYYMFFDNLKTLYDENKDKNYSDGKFFNTAIRTTIQQYAGGQGGNRSKRLSLTAQEITDDGDLSFPSIRNQKGQNTFLCTEKAVISHNLWLLMGAKSYFCYTTSDSFGANSEEYKNDTHNFTIVEYGDKFRLYDLSMDNFCELPNTCIYDMLSGNGLSVQGVKNPGTYVNKEPDKQITKEQ